MTGWKHINGNMIHETAILFDGVELGTGNVIMPYAVIGGYGFIRGKEDYLTGSVKIGNNNRIGAHTCIMHNTVIGDNNLIMNLVNIGHDCTIGNGNEIGAGSIICGHVDICNESKIKVASTIRNRSHIGSRCVIGMGANVVKDVSSDSSVWGNPAK